MKEEKGEKSNGQIKQELAEDRTDWAQYRTQLAGERNYSAWVRTGLTAVVAGLGVARLLHEMGEPQLTRTLGILFIAAGGAFFLLALFGYRKMHGRLHREGFKVTPFWVMSAVTLLLLSGTVIAFLLVLM